MTPTRTSVATDCAGGTGGGRGSIDRRARGHDLLDGRDHRQQHVERPAGRRFEECPELRLEQLGPSQAQPDAADSERRVHLRRAGQVRCRLVAADVERPEHDRPARDGLRDPAVQGSLLLEPGRDRAAHEQQLRPDEADPLGAGGGGGLGLVDRSDVGEHLDRQRRRVVACDGRGGVGATAIRSAGAGSDKELADRTVHGDLRAFEAIAQAGPEAQRERDPEGAGHDRGVAGRGTTGERDAR